MSNKRRLVVTLHHRDEFSLGDHRQNLCYEAYHWGIMIMPKTSKGSDCNAYDASDASDIDPETRQLRNTNLEWWFRAKRGVNPERSGRLLGRIVIGKIPNNISDHAVEDLLRGIPLPVKNAHPPQSCVTWTLNAIVALQDAGLAWSFDLDKFRDWALAYADQCLKKPKPGDLREYEHAKK
ncbi:hypothetical protein ACJ41O_005823 [Fusarium nematophilum]